ncbi:GNAT family N-acetyltransferase [Lachnoclostridium phytofermentans]|uniref:GCN5-related N-acetyltransferase n=1 Tax=Lachnoclostridium phytofermentans (strain ATCC 700394 / DSM 18823 / ISDg) TaxID=357809 RepID=A9KR10_LACP7|nr:GNAT family N-acetyltransferase [Lachnoclostridium phytofermentans]ABX43489.1 GCN5-related N-acetyltransferase [Lachnoclostridium phytofermentans ISDg]
MIYFESSTLTIRDILIEDAGVFYNTYLSYGWHPSLETYLGYFKEQQENKRKVFVAVYEGNVAGICTLVLSPEEGPFGNQNIPEIVDFGVFFDKNNLGIGNKLLDIVEGEAANISDLVYLAVGVHSGYGAAQRIYVKRGYIPDGSGVWYQGKQLGQYAQCCNDDDLVLFFSKNIAIK